MTDGQPRNETTRDILADGRVSFRRVGWRQIGEIAEGLIVRLLKQRAANDNEPAGH